MQIPFAFFLSRYCRVSSAVRGRDWYFFIALRIFPKQLWQYHLLVFAIGLLPHWAQRPDFLNFACRSASFFSAVPSRQNKLFCLEGQDLNN